MVEYSTELITPTTPTPIAMSEKDSSASAGLSALADLASSPPPSTARTIGLIKYSSPPPPSSSMTPPPSSQIPQRLSSPAFKTDRKEFQTTLVARTPTPTTSLLTSPPLTATQCAAARPKLSVTSSPTAFQLPTPEQLLSNSPTELRALINSASIEIQHLRTLSAHLKLQHTLLSIETEEATKRMIVEHDMTRREVEILLLREFSDETAKQHTRSSADPQSGEERARLVSGLSEHYEELQAHNEVITRRLRKAKKVISQRDGEVSSLMEENQRLRHRIQDNREHVNLLLRHGGILDLSSPRGGLDTVPVTPQRNTPRQQVFGSAKNTPRGGEDTFAALLLADQVLNGASAPSTPQRKQVSSKPNQPRHQRGSQSLSSLQPSPGRVSRPVTARSGALLPPLVIPETEEEANRERMQRERQLEKEWMLMEVEREREREERDSTISASDHEELIRDDDETDVDDDHIGQSQASQLATSLLRRAPTVEPKSAKRSALLQTKLFGKISKSRSDNLPEASILGKRKGGSQANGVGHAKSPEMKRMKVGEGVGLGIGTWTGARS